MDRALSPLDGRYSDMTAPLRDLFSEHELQRQRVRVEVEYLLTLANLEETSFSVDTQTAEQIRELYRSFDEDDMDAIRRIEDRTGHDVKAVVDWVQEHVPEASAFVHFGLTSEDVTNIAYAVLVRDAVEDVLLPALTDLMQTLTDRVETWTDLPMLGETHGQAATPTTLGKELAVFLQRLLDLLPELEDATAGIEGKLGGATGSLNAHSVAMPGVAWQEVAREFVTSFGLTYRPVTTQVKPRDDLARLFHALVRVNNVMIDMDRDIWSYMSRGWLARQTEKAEVGSSTMPHKVNPIEFENAEGNLSKANSDLTFLADALTRSRMQRDLSDSTVRRNIGVALGHTLLAWKKTQDGLKRLHAREETLQEALQGHEEILAEAIQTVLRTTGDPDAYEEVKEQLGDRNIEEIIDSLQLPEEKQERLDGLKPATYTGIAPEQAETVVQRARDLLAETGQE